MSSGGLWSWPSRPCEWLAKRLRGRPVSRTVTLRRARPSCRAPARPAKLPPMMMTSSMVIGSVLWMEDWAGLGGLGWGLARNCSSRGADYLSNAAHEIVVCAACIPSAAQSAERGDGGARSLGLCLCLRVLYLQQVAVRVQHFDQTDDATFVCAKRAFACARERGFAPDENVDLGLAVDECGKGILHFLGRLQDGESIGRQRFRLLAACGGDLCFDTAEIEQAPTKT